MTTICSFGYFILFEMITPSLHSLFNLVQPDALLTMSRYHVIQFQQIISCLNLSECILEFVVEAEYAHVEKRKKYYSISRYNLLVISL